ncbi:hypothetical protein SAISM_2671, partial [Staphylococcus aureus subsp. aureus IS-M]
MTAHIALMAIDGLLILLIVVQRRYIATGEVDKAGNRIKQFWNL